jgi:hypothetical protein
MIGNTLSEFIDDIRMAHQILQRLRVHSRSYRNKEIRYIHPPSVLGSADSCPAGCFGNSSKHRPSSGSCGFRHLSLCFQSHTCCSFFHCPEVLSERALRPTALPLQSSLPRNPASLLSVSVHNNSVSKEMLAKCCNFLNMCLSRRYSGIVWS